MFQETLQCFSSDTILVYGIEVRTWKLELYRVGAPKYEGEGEFKSVFPDLVSRAFHKPFEQAFRAQAQARST